MSFSNAGVIDGVFFIYNVFTIYVVASNNLVLVW